MKIILFALFTLFVFSAHAQTNSDPDAFMTKAFSIGPEVAIPLKSHYKTGYGGSLKFEWPLAGDGYGVSLMAGYTQFSFKNPAEDGQPKAAFIPVKAGAAAFLSPDIYMDFDLGAAIGLNYEKQKLLLTALAPATLYIAEKPPALI